MNLSTASSITIVGILRETRSTLRGQKIAFAMICLLVGAMCAVVVVNTSRAQAADRQVASRIEQAGSRVLTITSLRGGPIGTQAGVSVLAGAPSIESVVGVGFATDVTAGSIGPGGTPVAAWSILGDLQAIVDLSAGRWPGPGEAIISEKAQELLGFDLPVGWVSSGVGVSSAVVGRFIPRPGYEDLDGVLQFQQSGATPSLRLVLTDAAVAMGAQKLALSIIDSSDPADLQVDSPMTLAQLQQDVKSDLGIFTRTLTLLALAAASLLIAIVVLSQVLLQRRDIGRRRALGAPRWAVIAIVVGQSTVPAFIGAVAGAGIATIFAFSDGQAPEPGLPLAAIVLGVLTAAGATIPPAIVSAFRDPVRTLRQP